MVCGSEVRDSVVLTVIIDLAQIKTVVTADGVVFCHGRHVDVGGLNEIDLNVLSRDIIVGLAQIGRRCNEIWLGLSAFALKLGRNRK